MRGGLDHSGSGMDDGRGETESIPGVRMGCEPSEYPAPKGRGIGADGGCVPSALDTPKLTLCSCELENPLGVTRRYIRIVESGNQKRRDLGTSQALLWRSVVEVQAVAQTSVEKRELDCRPSHDAGDVDRPSQALRDAFIADLPETGKGCFGNYSTDAWDPF